MILLFCMSKPVTVLVFNATMAYDLKTMLETLIDKPVQDLLIDYLNAKPFPHLVIDNFFEDSFAITLEEECRQANCNVNASNGFTQKGKVALNDWPLFTPSMEKACCYFNSGNFISLLESVTGVNHLISDPFLEGGGLHRTERGGFLKMHTDFNFNKRLNLHRRINVLYYLNYGYLNEWGGNLLLSPTPAREKIADMASIPPIFNRLIIFNTNDKTFHGHPKPHCFPLDKPRTSLAFYYYSTSKPLSERGRFKTETTKYVPAIDDIINAKNRSLKSRVGYYLRRWTPFG